MLERKAYRRFVEWKQHKRNRALLVTGARQVGKTFLIRQFLENEYEHHVAFDLVDERRTLESFQNARDAADLLFRISAATSEPLVPDETAIFIDEIQEFPDIVTYAKYLAQRTEFDFIFSGSLLGTQLEGIRSLPVGYVSEVEMFPLDFEEFCLANGVGTDVFGQLHEAHKDCMPVPDFLHERLMHLYRRYLLVGGMPDVVNAFLDTGLAGPVREAQANIVRYYERDIAQYAPKETRLAIQGIYRLIPGELSGTNRRFTLKNVPGVKRFNHVEDEFLWLTNAGVAISVNNANEPTPPLLATRENNRFKLYYSDVGLLFGTLTGASSLDLLDGKPAMNLGGVYENAVAEELHTRGFDLYYHSSRRIGELDFAFEKSNGELVLVEVKSGRSYRSHAALDKALATENYAIAHAYVLADTNVKNHGAVTYLPLYMASVI